MIKSELWHCYVMFQGGGSQGLSLTSVSDITGRRRTWGHSPWRRGMRLSTWRRVVLVGLGTILELHCSNIALILDMVEIKLWLQQRISDSNWLFHKILVYLSFQMDLIMSCKKKLKGKNSCSCSFMLCLLKGFIILREARRAFFVR